MTVRIARFFLKRFGTVDLWLMRYQIQAALYSGFYFSGLIDRGHVRPNEWVSAEAGCCSECVVIFLFGDDI